MSRIELNRKDNPSCIRCGNKEERERVAENDLCNCAKSVEDNLPVRCVGEWAEEKIYLLNQYFGIFAEGMKNKWSLNYIEICSGPGRCVNRKNGKEFDGTSLSILKHDQFRYVNKALFFDYDTNVTETLNQRIGSLGLTQKAVAKHGDYNKPDSICTELAQFNTYYCLNLIFIDPTDCSLPFSLLRRISNVLPKFDLIINVATGTDFNRNIKMAFEDPTRAEKYIRFLGNEGFFTDPVNIAYFNRGDFRNLRMNFRNYYMDSLKTIGFRHFDCKQIRNFYDIVFATANARGIDFWKKATKDIESSGQRTIDFE